MRRIGRDPKLPTPDSSPGFSARLVTRLYELFRDIALREYEQDIVITVDAIGIKITVGGDVFVSDSAKGIILKDTASPAHYWRVQVNTLGVLTTTDLGTTAP